MLDHFRQFGWLRFPMDPRVRSWAEQARDAAADAISDPAHAQWLECEGTWFIGVDALPNDAEGRLPSGAPLEGPAVDFISKHLGVLPPLHRAQLSVIYPGYPRPRRGESDAAFGYRRNRDAAHVDGIKMFGGPAAVASRSRMPGFWGYR